MTKSAAASDAAELADAEAADALADAADADADAADALEDAADADAEAADADPLDAALEDFDELVHAARPSANTSTAAHAKMDRTLERFMMKPPLPSLS